MHAPDAVIHHLDAWFGELLRDMADHLGAEAIVSEEDIANPGYQNSGRGHTSLTLTCAAISGTCGHPVWNGHPPGLLRQPRQPRFLWLSNPLLPFLNSLR